MISQTYTVAPEQLTVPLNKLPCDQKKKGKKADDGHDDIRKVDGTRNGYK